MCVPSRVGRGGSMRCTTGSTGVTFCGKHGGGCAAKALRRGRVRRRFRPSNNEGQGSFWRKFRKLCVQADIVLPRISPLLANIYLNKLDRIWAARCSQLGTLVRYADDLVVMCRSASAAREALRRIGLVMNRLGLTLHPVKTRLVDLRRGKESFVFLGCTIRKKRSIQRAPDKHFMQRWPSPKATKKLRD